MQSYAHPTERRLNLSRPYVWQTIGWLMVACVVILTLIPSSASVSLPFFLSWDKFQHLLAYTIQMWWFRQVLAPRLLWVGFFLALGIALEYLQGWFGYREFDYGDMVFNGLGVMLGLWLANTALGRTVAALDVRLERYLEKTH